MNIIDLEISVTVCHIDTAEIFLSSNSHNRCFILYDVNDGNILYHNIESVDSISRAGQNTPIIICNTLQELISSNVITLYYF